MTIIPDDAAPTHDALPGANDAPTHPPSVVGDEQGGATFFDGKKREVGWASLVRKRAQGLTRLTVLDVTTRETSLATFLRTLDRGRLIVRWQNTDSPYVFAWASGYPNGDSIRVQGMLESSESPWASSPKSG